MGMESAYKLTKDRILASKGRTFTSPKNAMMQEERKYILEFLNNIINSVEK